MEIGSVFEIAPRSLFLPESTVRKKYPFEGEYEWLFNYFNTGRAAIEALLVYLKQEGRTSIWLPSYDCDSVLGAAKRSGIEIHYYRVGKDLRIITQDLDEIKQKSILYVVSLFGKTEDSKTFSKIEELKSKGVTIIEDLTLALFSEGKGVGYGDYVIGSVRKWLPVPDGGFVASKQELPPFEKEQAAYDYTLYYLTAQLMKNEYVKDNSLDKQQFLSLSNKGMESLFFDYTIREMSQITLRVLNNTDFRSVRKTRKENYCYLYQHLQKISEIKLMVEPSETIVPLGMVICTEGRDALFRYLVQNGIYCNIHWRPNESTMQFEDSDYLSKHCLTIPCDQRYGKVEMDYIVQTIKNYYHYV